MVSASELYKRRSAFGFGSKAALLASVFILVNCGGDSDNDQEENAPENTEQSDLSNLKPTPKPKSIPARKSTAPSKAEQTEENTDGNGIATQDTQAPDTAQEPPNPDGNVVAKADTPDIETVPSPQQIATEKDGEDTSDGAPTDTQEGSSETGLEEGAVTPARFKDCDDCPELVEINAGSFEIGASVRDFEADETELPNRKLSFTKNFFIGLTEVTNAEFQAFVAANYYQTHKGCLIDSNGNGAWKVDSGADWRSPGFPYVDDAPVVCVSHYDAIAYVNWLSQETGQKYRLATEAEWEYVARAGGVFKYGEGVSRKNICDYANVADQTANGNYPDWDVFKCDDGYVTAAPAGSFQPNEFGVYDMIGNVWEWTGECYNTTLGEITPPGDTPSAEECQQISVRGGSWGSNRKRSRVSDRFKEAPKAMDSNIGFRVVRESE